MSGSNLRHDVWRTGRVDQLGPDDVPIVRAQIPEGIDRGNLSPPPREGGARGLDASDDLVCVLLIDRKFCGDDLSALQGVLSDCHV